MKKRKFVKKVITLLAGLMIILVFSGQALFAASENSGAIWTTNRDGDVNVNIYDSKEDIFLNGGPKGGGNGLEDGQYYVQVTTPKGELLGSSFPDTVNVVDGILARVSLWSILKKASDKSIGYDSTTNKGGEYKVWISKNPDFKDSESKTDNFNVGIHPAINVIKTPNSTTARQGDTITYNYSVTNTGDTPLTNVTLNDNKLGAIVLMDTTLDVGKATTGSTIYSVLESDFPGPLENVATAKGEYGKKENQFVTATASASVNLTKNLNQNPGISLDKTVTPTTGKLGDEVTYSYTIKNTGEINFITVSLVDNKLGTIDLDPTSQANTVPLNVNEFVTVTKSHTLGAEDFPEGSQTLTNTATATGSYCKNGSINAADSVDVTLITSPHELVPGITIDKNVDKTIAQGGDTITYTYVIKNIGELDLSRVSLLDDKLGPIDLNADNLKSEVIELAQGNSITVTKTYTVKNGDLPLTNLATVKGYYSVNEGDFVTAQDSVTINKRTNGDDGESTPSDPPTFPEEKPGMIEVTKSIEGGGPQTEVTFNLYKGKELIKSGVTNDKGVLLFEGLEPGKDYSLEELVPQGFKTNLNEKTLITVSSQKISKIAVVNTRTVPPISEQDEPQPPAPPIEENKPVPTQNIKELPLTGGYPLAYLISGILVSGIGLAIRKRK